MPIETIALTKWDDIHEHARHSWVFRGQRRAEWSLKTALERCCERHKVSANHRRELEDRLTREFRRAYHQYGRHLPQRDAAIEWLSLMQHHGAPTRLLDFSYSIYVAAYFAVEATDSDSAVWAIDAQWAMDKSVELLRRAGKNEYALERLRGLFEDPKDEEAVSQLWFDEPHLCATWPINPFRLIERLRTQQGVFMVPCDISKSFMNNLEALSPSDHAEHVLKIIIPHSIMQTALSNCFRWPFHAPPYSLDLTDFPNHWGSIILEHTLPLSGNNAVV